jgi:cytoskeleton protein RodZ
VGDSAGARLTAERRNLGLSLGDIARQLKLSVRQVEALERDDYASFAGPVFVRGFLRNYAKLLSLDPDALIAVASPSPAAVSAPPPPVEEERRTAANPERSRRILTSVVIVALVVIAVVLLASNAARDRRVDVPGNDTPALQPPPAGGPMAQSEPPPTTSALPAPPPDAAVAQQKPIPLASETAAPSAVQSSSPLPTASQPVTAAPSNMPSNAAEPAAKPRILVSGSGPAQVRMVFEGESWVEVRDASGTTIFSRLNTAGTERLIRGNPPLSLVVGNASSVKLLYHEKPVDLQPHTRVDVARITLE